MTQVLAFDVNETLLDLKALDQPFEDLLGSAALRPQWFSQMLQLSFVGGIVGSYVDFTSAQRAALSMVARKAGVEITSDDIVAMVDRMSSLPPHPEVPDALATLNGSGLTVVALVNSLASVGEQQLKHAGIRDAFDAVISADEVKALKPSPKPYQLVAERYGVGIGDVRLVAAHSWDITGALTAGAPAAFVARPGMVMSPHGPQPDITGPDISAVVEQILAQHSH